MLLGLAIAPGLAIIIYIYWKDKYEREPRKLLLYAFLLGCLSIIPAIILESWWTARGFEISTNNWLTAFYAFIVVGLSEEISKFLFMRRFIFKHPEFDEPFDGITYTVMVSMGFATLENIAYVYQGGIGTAIVRMFMAVPAHASFGVIMGYYLGLARFNPKKSLRYMIYGIAGATFFHGAYDFALMQQSWPELTSIGAIIALYVGIVLSRRAIRIHQTASPFKVEDHSN